MKISNVFYILSRLWLILSICLILPVPFSLYYRDRLHFIFILTSIGIATVSIILNRLITTPSELSTKDGYLTVSLSWVSFSFIGAIPFLASGAIPSLTDAYFETMSGFTTTGATILIDIEVIPKSLLFWRNMTQWLGGMGVIALAVAILPLLGVGGFQLFKAEAPGPTKDKIAPKISDTAKLLWMVYLFFTALQTILLMLGGLGLFEALCITFGTLATGGYAPLNASIAAYPSQYIQYVIILFMFIAGVNFNLHYWALKGSPDKYLKNPEFRFFIGVILVSTLLITIIRIINGEEISEALIRSCLFQTVSIVTTTGFITENYEQWPFVTQFMLLLLMFIGGCASSTGGAIKNIRICVLFKFLGNQLKKLFYPRGVFPVKVGDKAISEDIVANIIAFIALYILLFVAGVLVMTFIGLNIDTSIGAVAATLGNIGPGIGAVGPVENFAHIPKVGKWFLCFLMLAGRLEIYTVFVLFTKRFWL
ncbi:MAG TPA: potassium transporter TrkG [Syntrophorhabdaceae bacterium]|nr:potassium transporter TrkG [Syntrophorhabdaceae bacterium]